MNNASTVYDTHNDFYDHWMLTIDEENNSFTEYYVMCNDMPAELKNDFYNEWPGVTRTVYTTGIAAHQYIFRNTSIVLSIMMNSIKYMVIYSQ